MQKLQLFFLFFVLVQSVCAQNDTTSLSCHLKFVEWNVTSENDSFSITNVIDSSKYTSTELTELQFSFSPNVNDTIWHYDCYLFYFGLVDKTV